MVIFLLVFRQGLHFNPEANSHMKRILTWRTALEIIAAAIALVLTVAGCAVKLDGNLTVEPDALALILGQETSDLSSSNPQSQP